MKHICESSRLLFTTCYNRNWSAGFKFGYFSALSSSSLKAQQLHSSQLNSSAASVYLNTLDNRLLHKLSTSTSGWQIHSYCSSVWGSKKRQWPAYRDIVQAKYINMPTEEQEQILAPLRAAVKEQGDLVRKLKEDKSDPLTIKAAVTQLKARRKALEQKELLFAEKEDKFDRLKMEDLLKQKFFYDISFSIYGGIAGQYDFGPMGCALKSNIIEVWRKHFILEENMLEIDSTILTPAPILEASGHVERFADFMVRDKGNGECFRADHVIQQLLERLINQTKDQNEINEARSIITQLETYGCKELKSVIDKYQLKSPLTGNELTDPEEFKLMFATTIGPSANIKAFLRPETAQGIFVNFKRLLEFNAGKLPFGGATIGRAFRNEISPRSGLIRVREFEMAEIEYFYDPDLMDHPKFSSVSELQLPLLSACHQMDGKPAVFTSVGEAVKAGLISNETLGYFMSRTFLFLKHIGLDPKRIRYRQHMGNEMAHYARDCWDCEVKTSYGWVECVGHADRSAFDLSNHARATNTKLSAEKKLKEPKTIQVNEVVTDKAAMGKLFKRDSKQISGYFSSLTDEQIQELKQNISDNSSIVITINGKDFQVPSNILTVKQYEKTVHVEDFIPHVIEPSFGVGRIMYALLEHTFRMRDGDEQRTYLSLPPSVAPYKCSVLPLSNNPDFAPFTKKFSDELRRAGVSHRVDESGGSIGRRYSRTDQIAIPFGITIDFDTLKEPHTTTLRERDSMLQVRAPMDELPGVIAQMSNGLLTWDDVLKKYPKFEQQETTK